MKKIIIGSRGSKLSLAYVEQAKHQIFKNLKDINIETRTIKTSGDIHNNIKLSTIGGKNLFCKEIEENLLEKKIDIALHSLKDMEAKEHPDLTIAAFIKRNDHRDVIVSSKINNFEDLKKKIALIGSSSKRREFQLKKINKNISIKNIRGNVDTRIKMLEEKKLDGIILAAAGVKSLKMDNKISFFLNTNEVLPAAGQGIIALQCRKKDSSILDILKRVNDRKAHLCGLAERTMLKTIGGDCDTAVGAFAEISKETLKLKAQLFSDDGKDSYNFELSGRSIDAEKIGANVGQSLLKLSRNKFKKK